MWRVLGNSKVIKMPDKISGIFRADKLRGVNPEYPQNIFMFSDKHTDFASKTCPESNELCNDDSCRDFFPRVLDRLIATTDEKVDFYIELNIYDIDSHRKPIFGLKRLMLPTVWKHFEECYDSRKERCVAKWKNLRYHYADQRTDTRGPLETFYHEFKHKIGDKTYTLKGTPMTRIEHMLDEQIREYKIWSTTDGEKRDRALRIIVNNLSEILRTTEMLLMYYQNSSRYFGEFFRTYRMSKQLYAVKPYDIVGKIQTYIASTSDPVYQKIQQKVRSILAADALMIEDVQSLYGALVHFNTYVMDSYLLARLFRHFDGRSQKNVIIYAGGTHINTYRKFLVGLGYSVDSYGFRVNEDSDTYFCTIVPDEFLTF